VKNVLDIKRIPIDIEINVTPWKYEMDTETARAARSKAQPIAQTAPQSSPAPMPVINDFSGKDYFDFAPAAPVARTYQPGSTTFGKSTNMVSYTEDDLVASTIRNPIHAQMAAHPIESVSQNLTNAAPQRSNVINWSNGRESVSFAADNAGDYTAIPARSEWKFVPSSVEVVVNQLPGLEIEYLGSPLYFPRSADPNYTPPAGA
jgi:hypothetical protein